MTYNLTPEQKDLLRWFVNAIRAGELDSDIHMIWMPDGARLSGYRGIDQPKFTKRMLDILVSQDLLFSQPNLKQRFASNGREMSTVESSRICVITQKGFDAVDSNFDTPDTSFVKHLTPLANIMHFDPEIKTRCLPILGAGSADPKLWDSAVRTAGVILEERIRVVGAISDSNRVGRDLVNDVFGAKGTLSDRFSSASEREGYRDLFAGMVGAFRNPSAHKLVDPSPESGGAYIVFVNYLLGVLVEIEKKSPVRQ